MHPIHPSSTLLSPIISYGIHVEYVHSIWYIHGFHMESTWNVNIPYEIHTWIDTTSEGSSLPAASKNANRYDREGFSLPAMSTNANQRDREGCPLPAASKNTNHRDRKVLPPCRINKRKSMQRKGLDTPCYVDSCGICGPNPHSFWHPRNLRVPISIPTKTHTHEHGYGFRRVWVQVLVELPMGYPWRALLPGWVLLLVVPVLYLYYSIYWLFNNQTGSDSKYGIFQAK